MQEQAMDNRHIDRHGEVQTSATSDLESNQQNNHIRVIIDRRIPALQQTAVNLATKAEQCTRASRSSKIALIVLGAFVATREVVNSIPGLPTIVPILVYTFIGLTISCVAGMEAYFQWEKRAQGLTTLAAISRERRQKFESNLAVIDTRMSGEEKMLAEQELLTKLDEVYSSMQKQAAELRVNVVLDVVPDSKRMAEYKNKLRN